MSIVKPVSLLTGGGGGGIAPPTSQALVLDRSLGGAYNPHVWIGDSTQTGLDGGQYLTLEGWFELSTLPGAAPDSTYGFFSKQDSPSTTSKKSYNVLFYNSAGLYYIAVYLWSSAATYVYNYWQVTPPALGRMTHYAFVMDVATVVSPPWSAQVKVYVDGVSLGPPDSTTSNWNLPDINNSSSEFCIGMGRKYGGEKTGWNGRIANPRAWSSARTEEETQATMGVLVDPGTPDLLADWRLDGNLLDNTAQNQDLTESPVISYEAL